MSKQENIQSTQVESQALEFASQLLEQVQGFTPLSTLRNQEKERQLIEKLTDGKFRFVEISDGKYKTYLDDAKIGIEDALQNYIETQSQREKQALPDAEKVTSNKILSGILRRIRSKL
jgi:hypothetical protein